jgi:Pyridoxamine 5'-phosphate oxidase
VAADEARRRFTPARVARLARADAAGRPADRLRAGPGERLQRRRPQSTMRLRRLCDVAENLAVALLVDHYEDDRSALWWVRADGTARVLPEGAEEALAAVAILRWR